MRKRKLPVIMALALMCCLVMLTGKSVEASEGEKIDGSYLTEGDSSAGKAVLKMRGVYLMTGDCSISKAGRGRIYAYASTTANMTVDYVGVIVYVDQYDEDEKAWKQVDAWLALLQRWKKHPGTRTTRRTNIARMQRSGDRKRRLQLVTEERAL